MANQQDAAKHLAGVAEKLSKDFGGKPGYNPYKYISEVINPALVKVSGTAVKQEDIDAALKITASEANARVEGLSPKAQAPQGKPEHQPVVFGGSITTPEKK